MRIKMLESLLSATFVSVTLVCWIFLHQFIIINSSSSNSSLLLSSDHSPQFSTIRHSALRHRACISAPVVHITHTLCSSGLRRCGDVDGIGGTLRLTCAASMFAMFHYEPRFDFIHWHSSAHTVMWFQQAKALLLAAMHALPLIATQKRGSTWH